MGGGGQNGVLSNHLTAAALMEGLTMPKGKPNFCKCET